MSFQDPQLLCVGKPTSKLAQTVTMIMGSNAFGKALPPHFQFMTHAEMDEGKQVKVDTAVFCPGILGQWGGEEEVCAPVTFGSRVQLVSADCGHATLPKCYSTGDGEMGDIKVCDLSHLSLMEVRKNEDKW